ncbi:hypothetical protein B566_EDAN012258 [Ephemera danica]|nr:hypothetical protein B566_EDAN012258 [Ephemera danica]
MWQAEDFFLKHLPHLCQIVDKKVKAAVTSSRLSYLQQKSQALSRDTQFYYFQVCSWLVQMDTCMRQDSTHLKLEHLQMRCALLLQGLDYAVGLKRLITTVTNLHVSLAQPMTKTSVVALCRLVELLKYIQFMFHAHSVAVAESMNHVIQHLTYQAIGIVIAAKRTMTGDSCKYSAAQLDILSSLLLAERAFHGAGTRDRRLVAHLALSTANQMKTFREEDILNLKHILRKLDMICDLQSQLTNACNCSFLYWHRVIIPIYFAHLFESRTELHCVKYICAAVNDSLIAIQHTKMNVTQQNLKKSVQKEMIGAFESQVLKPLCHQIEMDLRLHVHSHLQLSARNPLLSTTHNCAPLLKTQPLLFFGQFISIKAYVENYLNQTFYNLTTVALHDWKTYGEMRCLAKQKYDLNTVEDDLPSQTLEQESKEVTVLGLDVLEILRNIHVFVSKYLYNLNNQIFIESSSNNKHLNTINIRHIANSIRTHGTGIMNTTVNFTYQFLKKKLYILSQFLYDEQIKSRLMRDLKYFHETKALNDQKFPFDRAEKLNRGIRKLGLTQDKLTYLDRFRILISHIGNAMGYVRMVRTGGLHCSSNAICFIPDLEDIVSFHELSQEQGFTTPSMDAAKALDHVLEMLAKNFDESTEYFKKCSSTKLPYNCSISDNKFCRAFNHC